MLRMQRTEGLIEKALYEQPWLFIHFHGSEMNSEGGISKKQGQNLKRRGGVLRNLGAEIEWLCFSEWVGQM